MRLQRENNFAHNWAATTTAYLVQQKLFVHFLLRLLLFFPRLHFFLFQEFEFIFVEALWCAWKMSDSLSSRFETST